MVHGHDVVFTNISRKDIVIFPCEKAVWYNLPQIRADIAAGLVKSGMTQSGAAGKLGVTPAAVSQYLHKKRGRQTEKTEEYLAEIETAVKKICAGACSNEIRAIMCRCCQIISRNDEEGGIVCQEKQ